jgi:O-antigen biosynthesis protein WbqP
MRDFPGVFVSHVGSSQMTRFLDIMFSVLGLSIGLPLMIIVTALCYFDTGSPFFVQERVGRNRQRFKILKFRTMEKHTSSVASHLVHPSSITKFGKYLRASKLDELPQLWNVLIGDMSLVGPRPNLPNQIELIKARSKLGVYNVRPGITGLAQVQSIDMSKPDLLAQIDRRMIVDMSVKNYLCFIALTLKGAGMGDRVK